MTRRLVLACLALALVAPAGCRDKVAGFEQRDDPRNLEALWQTVQRRFGKGDLEGGAALIRSTLPDRAALSRALRPSVDPHVVERLQDMYQKLSSLDAQAIARGLKPQRTKVRVRAASGRDIATYEDPAVKAAFPVGARQVAAAILRPGVTFYQVELLEPGADKGTKFHLFFWGGSRWRTLGPAWRALR